MSSRQLRSEKLKPGEWLVGKYVTSLKYSQLPTKRSVLSFFLYHHYELEESVNESLNKTKGAVLNISTTNNVIKDFHVKEKVNKLFKAWKSLKKNRWRLSKTQRHNENKFSNSLDEQFDISLQCSSLNDQTLNSAPSTSTKVSLKNLNELSKPLSQKSNLSLSSASSHELYASPPKKKIKYVISEELSSMLNRTKTSNRNGLLLMSAFSATLDRKVSDVTVSKETIRRTRQKHRTDTALRLKSSFCPKVPLTVYWDTKIFKAYKSTEAEDRLAVVVSGQGISKMLGVVIIKQSTGLSQSNGVYDLIKEWNLDDIMSMAFDTTASNTGNKVGACTLLEKKFQRKLLHLACRHHILELILTATFGLLLEPVVSGPNIKLFERFRNE